MKYLADGRLIRREPIVTGERQVSSAAGRRPIDGCQDRFRCIADRQGDVFPGAHEVFTARTEHAEVSAGAECATGAGYDDDAHGIGGSEHAQRLDQVVTGLRIKGVELLRPIERHGPDMAIDLDEHPLVRSHQTRSTTIAIP